MKISQRNAANRAKLVTKHTCTTRSFAEVEESMVNTLSFLSSFWSFYLIELLNVLGCGREIRTLVKSHHRMRFGLNNIPRKIKKENSSGLIRYPKKFTTNFIILSFNKKKLILNLNLHMMRCCYKFLVRSLAIFGVKELEKDHQQKGPDIWITCKKKYKGLLSWLENP